MYDKAIAPGNNNILDSVAVSYKNGKAHLSCKDKNLDLSVTTPLKNFEMDCVCDDDECLWYANTGNEGYDIVERSIAETWYCDIPFSSAKLEADIENMKLAAATSLPELSFAELLFKLDRPWSDDLSDNNSDDYQSLSTEFYDSFGWPGSSPIPLPLGSITLVEVRFVQKANSDNELETLAVLDVGIEPLMENLNPRPENENRGDRGPWWENLGQTDKFYDRGKQNMEWAGTYFKHTTGTTNWIQARGYSKLLISCFFS